MGLCRLTFFQNNKKIINIVLIASCVLDSIIGFIINIVSQNGFDINSTHNKVVLVILAFCVFLLCAFQVFLNNTKQKNKNKQLQKAFKEHGGYDTIADEMMKCIKCQDYESVKKLKKIAEYIEK